MPVKGRTVRVGIIRCDTHGYWYAPFFQAPDPELYRQVHVGCHYYFYHWDDPRRLRVGRILREWNLDEVPQFWNVLRGEMSLVGPRPERPELIARFKYEIPHYNARHAAKPGITGWAQVHGLRGDTDLSQRVRYDLWYLENWGFWLDFQIMLMTFFNRKNAY